MRRAGMGSAAGLLAMAAWLAVGIGWPAGSARAGSMGDRRTVSRSIGFPARGLLVGGAEVRESERIRHPVGDAERGWFWGTAELVALVGRAAAHVAREAPGGARLQVGELSRRGGGNIPGHRSHENGRDVDLGFYVTDDGGSPLETEAFVNIGWHGKGTWRGERVRFDDERNWRLVEALVSQTEVPVQYIFTHHGIRRRLLRTAERLDVPAPIRERAERVLLPPRGSRHPHRNHFHVRVYCDPEDVPGCRDRGVVWSWVPEAFLGDPRTVRAAH